MDRRQFLIRLSRLGLATGLLSVFPLSRVFAKGKNPHPGMWLIDAHAHPYSFYRAQLDPEGHTFEMMREAGIVASSFAAVGDYIEGSEYDDTLRQLAVVKEWEGQGLIKIMRGPQKIRQRFGPDAPICAILTIEGGDALEGDINHLDEFYEMGVRIITLVHNNSNQIGNDMRDHASDDPNDTGLTDFGYLVVERMNELGMVIDVAHASTQTLFDIAEFTQAPIIDSHTNPLPSFVTERPPGRLRTYSEMEAVVNTGGVVCTWPLAYESTFSRLTFSDWVQEIEEFKTHFGIRHIGMGTDGGGGLPALIEGWNDVSDLDLLIKAMGEADFRHREIAAFMGANVLKVMHKCYRISKVPKRKSKREKTA